MPAARIRLSALQTDLAVIYVMTHDSIGLGEDGPTHQPVEHLASLRAYAQSAGDAPCRCGGNGRVLGDCSPAGRPPDGTGADPSEPVAAAARKRAKNLSASGGYRIKPADAARKVVILATGSEVELAADCAAQLEAAGVGTDVVSMVCTETVRRACRKPHRADILPDDALIVSIEAASTFGVAALQPATGGLNIGLDSFGASAPAGDLFAHFGLHCGARLSRKFLQQLNA